MRVLSGPLLMAVGVLDLLYVLVFHSRQLAAIARDGFFDAVEIGPAHLDREVAFWHLTFGITVVILGGLVSWTQARTGVLPAFPWAGRCWPSAFLARFWFRSPVSGRFRRWPS